MKIDYRHFNVKPGETLAIDAPDELYCIQQVDKDIRVESDGRYYDLGNPLWVDNQHCHWDIIRIHNRRNVMRDAMFIVGIGK